jgi:hypothetical protein
MAAIPSLPNAVLVATHNLAARGHVYPGASAPSSLRVGPTRSGQRLASLWRFWVSGNDVYVANRNVGKHTRVSLHASGTWFVWIGSARTMLAPPLLLSGGQWLHALELAFLVPPNSLPLPELKPLKPREKALLIETPVEHKLTMNILFGAVPETSHSTPLPPELTGHTLMQAKLARGTPVAVVARRHPFSAEDREVIEQHRVGLGFRVHTEKPQERPGLEILVISAPTAVANVISVIGMGPEAFTTAAAPGANGAAIGGS